MLALIPQRILPPIPSLTRRLVPKKTKSATFTKQTIVDAEWQEYQEYQDTELEGPYPWNLYQRAMKLNGNWAHYLVNYYV